MSEENTPNSEIDVLIVIDKDKLPEDIRERLPQDLQNKLVELLQGKTIPPPTSPLRDKQSSHLFAVQYGTVVGNIYKDGIAPEEKLIYKTKVRQENNDIHQEYDKTIPIQDEKVI